MLQSITTESMVESVLNMFERFVNSDSTIDIFDNSFQYYFKVLSMDHVNFSKHRRKAIPQKNYVSSCIGCRTGQYYAVNSKEGFQSQKFDPNNNDPTYDELVNLTDRKNSPRLQKKMRQE